MHWLPEGKRAAVCFSIDDVHPSSSVDGYDAGGSLGDGALGRVERLLGEHPQLRVTLSVTPEWRPIQLVRKGVLSRLPVVASRVYHVDLNPPGHFRVDRFPEFVAYLNGLPRTDVAIHGLHHVHRGSRFAVEFQNQSYEECVAIVHTASTIFALAGLRFVRGFVPPGWQLPPPLKRALDDSGFSFVCSARDIRTEIRRGAKNGMSGLRGVSLLEPELIGDSLVHVPTNFQATSDLSRAERIVECNGLLSIKAHIFKEAGGHTMVDGLDDAYADRLSSLLTRLETAYGDSLWWASLDEVAERTRAAKGLEWRTASTQTAPPREKRSHLMANT
jgi:hypothetical protein